MLVHKKIIKTQDKSESLKKMHQQIYIFLGKNPAEMVHSQHVLKMPGRFQGKFQSHVGIAVLYLLPCKLLTLTSFFVTAPECLTVKAAKQVFNC